MNPTHLQQISWKLIILVAVCLIAGLGNYDFYSRGEAREAIVTQSMVTSGDYILPLGYSNHVPSKPPLFHWVGAGISQLTGSVNEFSVRLPSAIFALAALIFFNLILAGKINNVALALFVPLLAFSPEWLRASTTARVDMVHAASLSCGLLSAFLAIQRNSFKYFLLSIILLALAVLGKGPVAIVIPALVLIPWTVYRRGLKGSLPSLFMLGFGLCLSFSIAAIWYIAAYYHSPQEFTQKFMEENFLRFTGEMADQPHRHHFPYLLGAFLVGMLPWSAIVLIFLVRDLRAHRRNIMIELKKLSELNKFCLLAGILIIFFYCLPASKRGVYILAAYPFWAVLFSQYLAYSLKINFRKIYYACAVYLILLTIAGFYIIPRQLAPAESEARLAKEISALDNKELYSFGFEFYGAAFYAKRKIKRLEEVSAKPNLNSSTNFNEAAIIVFKHDLPKLESSIDSYKITLKPFKETQIGKKSALIFLVSQQDIPN